MSRKLKIIILALVYSGLMAVYIWQYDGLAIINAKLNEIKLFFNPKKAQAAESANSPPDAEITATSVCQSAPGKAPEMVIIPAGSFKLGSEKEVTIRRPFAIGRCEVTFAEYDLFVQATGAQKPDDEGWGRQDRPVINVSWEDAQEYIRWLSQVTGRRYRLPTEAEWEYAARAGTTTRYYWGDDEDRASDYAWYGENSGGKTHPVGLKKSNAFGLYDISGNVWEWVQDCWHDDYNNVPADGSAWEAAKGHDCIRRLRRGGSWFNFPRFVRSAIRFRYFPNSRNFRIGFRLAQDL